MKTNVQDFDVPLLKGSIIRSQFLTCKLRLLTAKTYSNFLAIDPFLLDL